MTYTQAQIDKANAVDLEKFLRAQGETLVRSGKEYRWKAHDSLTVCGNKWFRHSQSKGGLPVDFVMEFYGKSFPEAVQMLTGEPGEAQPEAGPAPSPAFRLPLRNVTNANILNYLTQERKLSPSLVNFFIAAGDIYEDAAHHNVVFVGRDADGHPRYASSRGIREKFRQDAAGAEKAFGFAHRGTDKQLLVFEAPIDLLSFIELFPKNWQQHNYLSLGGVSGKALRQFLSERPDVERVFLCLDADKAGEDACKRLTALLPDTVSVTRIQPCMKDWNDVLVHRAEISNRNYFKSIVLKEPSKPETVKIIRMSDVELTPVEWLWKPYLPFGKLSVLQGNPGEGKTYFAMHLAAACTNGKLLPNMERMEPFNVIYQTAEDGLGDTVKPRLIEAGADLDRVLVIDDSDVQLTLSDERIEKAIIENNARLVIIDPIQAYLGADVDMNRANEVRPIFMRLGQVAQRTGCAILLIGHLNKAAGMQSLQRGLGSIDIAAAVRSVMFIGKLKHDPTMRILTHEKSSLAPPGVSLAFSLGDEGGFRWVGEYDITADEMLSGIEPQRETKTQQAKDLICTLLAGGKQVLSEDIDKAALERGIPGRTVRDAKRELGDALKSKIVEGRKRSFGWNKPFDWQKILAGKKIMVHPQLPVCQPN
ncbi:MAG: AAA family ATPase [Faecalibacterium prausnitzii]